MKCDDESWMVNHQCGWPDEESRGRGCVFCACLMLGPHEEQRHWVKWGCVIMVVMLSVCEPRVSEK
eukprot:9884654-Alexandrium_andersonii.AAC.1